jgi:hypothetical protein
MGHDMTTLDNSFSFISFAFFALKNLLNNGSQLCDGEPLSWHQV